MSSYISTLTLMENAVASESSEESDWTDYAEGASRLFDRLCDVEEDFFNKATSEPSERTFWGSGVDMIELPPFLQGTIASIEIDGDAFDEDDYRIVKNYVIRTDDGEFDEDEEIVISARWGFAEIPKDVQIVVNELAAYLYRNRDPMFAKISDVEVEKELSPTVNAAVKKYRDKYGSSAN